MSPFYARAVKNASWKMEIKAIRFLTKVQQAGTINHQCNVPPHYLKHETDLFNSNSSQVGLDHPRLCAAPHVCVDAGLVQHVGGKCFDAGQKFFRYSSQRNKRSDYAAQQGATDRN